MDRLVPVHKNYFVAQFYLQTFPFSANNTLVELIVFNVKDHIRFYIGWH